MLQKSSSAHLCSYNQLIIHELQDLLPTSTQIDLSIERIYVNNQITKHLLQKTKCNINDFEVPAYILDFGHVILSTHVCYTVRMTNLSFVKIDVKVDKTKCAHSLDFDEFKIEFRYKRIEVGESTELFVLFKPSKRRYGLTEMSVQNEFCLRLKDGGCVPVKVLATVTMPRVHLMYNYIDFGNAILGEAIRRSIVIKNE